MDDIPWSPDHPLYLDTAEEFFAGDPGADFNKWSRVQHWTLEEGASLSFGFDPEKVTSDLLQTYPEHPFVVEYDRRLDLARRAVEDGDLLIRNSPRKFIKWANTVGMGFPESLINLVKQSITMAKPLARTSSTSGLLKMVKTDSKIALAMAKDMYGFDPAQPLPAILEEITTDLRGVGITVQALEVENALGDVLDIENLEDAHTTLCKVIYGLAKKYYDHNPAASRSHGAKNIAKILLDSVDVGAIRSRLHWGFSLMDS